MKNSIDSRRISEHLCTLATLLEAEGMRGRALGAPNAKELTRKADEVRSLADRLWEADMLLPLAVNAGKPAVQARPPRQDAARSLQALGLGESVAALVS